MTANKESIILIFFILFLEFSTSIVWGMAV